jgi:hypothetical protein
MERVRNERKWVGWFCGMGFSCIALAVVLLLGVWSTAEAFVIIDDEGVALRWDNTIRYNYGIRTRSPQGCILNSANYDDGDRNFGKSGDIVANRLDLLSELDFTYKRFYGARVSGAFWYDQRYVGGLDNNSVATSNHLENGMQALGLSDQAKRLSRGPDGEVLDAFVYGRFDIGSVPINLKVGRHTVYWGEAFLSNATGISYSQMPIDYSKALAVPGTEVKELFRPLNNISMQAQLTHTISLAGQYFLQWESYRYPEAGTYLGPADIYGNGGEMMILAPGFFITKGSSSEPDGTKNWGVAVNWNPEWLGGTLGFYYRRFADMIPQMNVVLTPVSPDIIVPTSWFFTYGDDIDLYGVSLSTKLFGVSVGAEVSYRKNMPLYSSAIYIIKGLTPMPEKGETFGARGNTWQGLINVMSLGSKTPLWDSSTLVAELVWSHWDKVTSGESYFLDGHDGYGGLDKVTDYAVGATVMFTPNWFQVFSGMDLSMPMVYSRGLYGNSATPAGSQANAGQWSVGFSLDVYQKYKFDVAYVGYFGDITEDGAGGIAGFNGLGALLKDRDTLTVTFKTTF